MTDSVEPLAVPPPLSRAPRVGVAALSGPVDGVRLEAGLHRLRDLGMAPVEAPNLRRASGFLAGTDEERLDGFHSLLETDVEAVFFARGGHGVLRVLEHLDWNHIGSQPRWFVGYSDLTPFLLEVNRRLGWTSLHGPMVATDLCRELCEAELRSLLSALHGSYREEWELRPTTGGAAAPPTLSGRLVGGCLSMICATLGTPASPVELFEDAVVFLEDVGEATYRVDRLLAQLGMAGLRSARAVVLGYCHQHPAALADEDAGSTPGRELKEVLEHHSRRLAIPIWVGLPAGHGVPNHALPLGGVATISGNRLEVRLGPRS